jgi:hypothetical protein
MQMMNTLFTRIFTHPGINVVCCKRTANGTPCTYRGTYLNSEDGFQYCGIHANAMRSRSTRETPLVIKAFCAHPTKQGRPCLNRGIYAQDNEVYYCGIHENLRSGKYKKNNAVTDEEITIQECAICISSIYRKVKSGDDKAYKTAPCNHHFHRGCITKWVQTGKRSCPLCRSQLRNVGRLSRAPPPPPSPQTPPPPPQTPTHDQHHIVAYVETTMDPLTYRPFNQWYPLDETEIRLIETPTNYWNFIRFSLGMITPSAVQREYFSNLINTSPNLRRMYEFYNV